MKQDSPDLGPKIRRLRTARGLSLAEVAAGSGVSEATMSRIETGHSQVSAPHLYGLAQMFGIELAAFFHDAPAQRSRRSVTRSGEGTAFSTPRLEARLMAGDLRAKAMHPFVNRTNAHALDQVGGLLGHAGEEYLHVLQGPLIFHSEAYEPLRLNTGDGLYFDATDPHAYLTDPGAEAIFLVVSSAISPHPLAKDAAP
jgi:transcriptional regulator with XRE-family HTH domain